MKFLLLLTLSLLAVASIKAEKFDTKDIDILKRFLNDPEVSEEESKLRCMARVALKLYDLGYNDTSDIRNWINSTLRTGIALAQHYYTCYLIKPGEGASRIEIIRYRACIETFRARAYVEYNLKKREAIELVKNDFWIQLVIGAYKCGVIPSPIVEGKGEIMKY